MLVIENTFKPRNYLIEFWDMTTRKVLTRSSLTEIYAAYPNAAKINEI